MAIVDKYGLVKDNELLVVYYPATNKAMVFRVVSRQNKQFEVWDWGTLPTTAGTVLNTYDGTTKTVGFNGELPARSYTTGLYFPQANCWDPTDQWFVPYTWNDRVYHVRTYVDPGFVRVGLQIPKGVNQSRFQKERIVGGADQEIGFGYNFGEMETVHLPEIHYGYVFGNDSNAPLRTGVKFVYGEYVVNIPSSASLIFDVLSRAYPAHWVGMPVSTTDAQITQSLKKTWGFDGFSVYPSLQRTDAIAEYTAILTSADVTGLGVLG